MLFVNQYAWLSLRLYHNKENNRTLRNFLKCFYYFTRHAILESYVFKLEKQAVKVTQKTKKKKKKKRKTATTTKAKKRNITELNEVNQN